MQTLMLTMMAESAADAGSNSPKVNDFLDVTDPANVGGATDTDYLSTVLIPQMFTALFDPNSGFTAATPQQPIVALADFCDQDA